MSSDQAPVTEMAMGNAPNAGGPQPSGGPLTRLPSQGRQLDIVEDDNFRVVNGPGSVRYFRNPGRLRQHTSGRSRL
jgi:hypothetical protein